MSQFYDLTQPYTITNWNTLVDAVNQVLQAPPAGSACVAVDTLSHVQDPHIWLVSDVTTMRNAIMETCPDIKFTQSLDVWHSGIIDEIVNSLQQAWCNCPPAGPIQWGPWNLQVAAHSRQPLEHGPAAALYRWGCLLRQHRHRQQVHDLRQRLLHDLCLDGRILRRLQRREHGTPHHRPDNFSDRPAKPDQLVYGAQDDEADRASASERQTILDGYTSQIDALLPLCRIIMRHLRDACIQVSCRCNALMRCSCYTSVLAGPRHYDYNGVAL